MGCYSLVSIVIHARLIFARWISIFRIHYRQAIDVSSYVQEQKLGKLVLDSGAAKDFERPFKSQLKSEDQVEQSSSKNQAGFKPPCSDSAHNDIAKRSDAEDTQKP